MPKIAIDKLSLKALNWAVAQAEPDFNYVLMEHVQWPDDAYWVQCADGVIRHHEEDHNNSSMNRRYLKKDWVPSENFDQGGAIMDREGITVIRCDDDYRVDAQGFSTSERIPVWFAECSRWKGHSTTTSYEGEHMEPTFMIAEAGGYYGPTMLVAAMRAYVACKLGAEVDVPEALA